MSQQTFKNHRRLVPLFHFVCLGLLAACFYHAVMRLYHAPSTETVYQLLLTFALLLLAWYARAFPVTAQDRIIRLEMKLRMQTLAPDLMTRFDSFRIKQLTALRFAGDAELPGLARQVLDGKLVKSADIKKQIRDWQADNLRV
jgi:hypothetical protein